MEQWNKIAGMYTYYSENVLVVNAPDTLYTVRASGWRARAEQKTIVPKQPQVEGRCAATDEKTSSFSRESG